ncbi:alpha/beta hydrolase [Nocardia takedensis]|uniref:alpha/beta hydrolase n=1 Tax=Nocardia takedensis TaxID=259390 RepID=UPI00059362C6|nr:hypothetical protein [Nocardia takedensis]
MVVPPYMQPFVLTVNEVARERDGVLDLYCPDAAEGPLPAVLFVHGGPLPAGLVATPRDWPIFQGYGALAAMSGLVGAVVDHGLDSPAAYGKAEADVRAAVERLRALPSVDSERVALWFFSGGGLLSAPWLREPPAWLRCVALTYPVLRPPVGWGVEAGFDPVDALSAAVDRPPVLLTRVGRESIAVAASVAEFTEVAERHEVGVDVIDVPDGVHGFDTADHNEDSRAAVRQAMTWVAAALRR